MVLALIFALLALATLSAVALPLLRPAQGVADRGQFDRAVYRDQLKELDRDLARGVLKPEEAKTARLEIQRRLLAVEGRSAKGWASTGSSPIAAAAVSAFVLIGAGALYIQLGSPALPDMPFASRTDESTAVAQNTQHLDLRDAAGKLRQKLASDPNNADAWLLYGRTESMLGHWDKARSAYDRAMALGRNGPDVLAAYGEMLVLGERGIVSPKARDSFKQALKADPGNDVARYYLALADAQAGQVKQAIAGWMSLAADIPEQSPMRAEIARRIAAAAQSGGIPAPTLPKGTPAKPAEAAAPGPDAATMAAAAKLPAKQREQMIRGMVAQLAAKMEKHPDDLDGWMRLGRAYMVLGEKDKAADAFRHAATLKPDDPAIKLRQAEALLVGLKGSDPLPPRAVALLRDVEKAAPNQPEALWYLGVFAARGGHLAEARDYWTRLLKVLPADSADARMVQTALQQVKAK